MTDGVKGFREINTQTSYIIIGFKRMHNMMLTIHSSKLIANSFTGDSWSKPACNNKFFSYCKQQWRDRYVTKMSKQR